MTATQDPSAPARTRDASRTRRLLMDAGRRRFAHDGYATTTVRDVARDAGVDVALIKRYFGSKEGLFEACLDAAVEDLRDGTRSTAEVDLARRIAGLAAGIEPGADDPDRAAGAHALLLLLRTSGDQGVDARRRDVLHRQSVQLARTVSGAAEPSHADVVRAQVVLATAVGVALLRTSPGLEPLRSASVDEIASVLADLVRPELDRTDLDRTELDRADPS